MQRSEAARGSDRLTQAMPWISEIEEAKTLDELSTSYRKCNKRLRDTGLGNRPVV